MNEENVHWIFDEARLMFRVCNLLALAAHGPTPQLELFALILDEQSTARDLVSKICSRQGLWSEKNDNKLLMICCHCIALTYYHVFNDNSLFLMHREFALETGVCQDIYATFDANGNTDRIRRNDVFPTLA